jgi:hypothetical protein
MESGSLQLLKQMLAAGAQGLQMLLNHPPDQLIVDCYVLMGELVAEADDDEFAFNGRANQAAVAVVVKADAMDSLADGMASVDYIRKKGPWITLHRSAS